MSHPGGEHTPEKQYSSVPQLVPFAAFVQLDMDVAGTQLWQGPLVAPLA
jgi:hypothetical protein